MTQAAVRPLERSFLYSPIALLPRDEFTGQAPLGRVTLRLQEQVELADGAKAWRETGVVPSVSTEGILSYPGLGRAVDLSGSPRRYRALIDADFYRPLYQNDRNGEEGECLQFRAHLYNDEVPLEDAANPENSRPYARGPALTKTDEHDAPPRLLPSPRYPFPPHVPVVRGRVIGGSGEPVVDAEVKHAEASGGGAGSLTDESGDFALAIRWPRRGLWPPNDVALAEAAAEGQPVITVDRLGGLAKDMEIELPDGSEVRLAEPASQGRRTIVVNDASGMIAQLRIVLQHGRLDPPDRRFVIQHVNVANRKVRLEQPLPRDMEAGTRVLSVFTVNQVNSLSRQVTLGSDLPKRFAAGTGVMIFAFAIDVTNNGASHIEEVQLPDGFRNLTIQL